MNDQEPYAVAGDAGSLQLDRAEYDENAPERCAACGQALGGSYYEVGGRVCCADCQQRLVAALAGRPGPAGFLRAAGAGLGAATVGSAIYFAVRAATGYEVGLISILVGFLVGKAVHWGCGGRGGWPYQTLAVLLTYLAIVSTYVPVLFGEWKRHEAAATAAAGAGGEGAKAASAAAPGQGQTAAAAATGQGQAAVMGQGQAAAAGDRAPARGADHEFGFFFALGQLATFLAILLLLAALEPFMGGVGILGLIIIAIGLYEAWKLNRRPRLQVTGPHALVPQGWRR